MKYPSTGYLNQRLRENKEKNIGHFLIGLVKEHNYQPVLMNKIKQLNKFETCVGLRGKISYNSLVFID